MAPKTTSTQNAKFSHRSTNPQNIIQTRGQKSGTEHRKLESRPQVH
jgi:hypothetical protein